MSSLLIITAEAVRGGAQPGAKWMSIDPRKLIVFAGLLGVGTDRV